MPRISRNITIVTSVLLLHVLVLWAMQTGLLRRVAQAFVPAEILVEIMPSPTLTPEAAPKHPTKSPAKISTPKVGQSSAPPVATTQPSPAPLAMAPSASAPPATSTAPTATAAAAAPTGAGTGTAVSPQPAPASLELPSSNADYLNNPKPPYPALSRRLGEQGTSVVHVLIGVDGSASQASIKRSSGFDRLDQAAVASALQWRYVPGKRAGVPEAMWFDIPFNWILN